MSMGEKPDPKLGTIQSKTFDMRNKEMHLEELPSLSRDSGPAPFLTGYCSPRQAVGDGLLIALGSCSKFPRISHFQPFLQHLREWRVVSSPSLLQIAHTQSAALPPGSRS